MRKYRTKLGETWDIIAYKMYENEYHMKELIEENFEYRDTVIFKSGIVLNIPDINQDESIRPAWLGDDEDI